MSTRIVIMYVSQFYNNLFLFLITKRVIKHHAQESFKINKYVNPSSYNICRRNCEYFVVCLRRRLLDLQNPLEVFTADEVLISLRPFSAVHLFLSKQLATYHKLGNERNSPLSASSTNPTCNHY